MFVKTEQLQSGHAYHFRIQSVKPCNIPQISKCTYFTKSVNTVKLHAAELKTKRPRNIRAFLED
jgi:hypothetical protein